MAGGAAAPTAPAAMELAQVKPEVTAENVADEDAISSLAGLGLPEPHASARTSWTPAGPDAAGSAAAAANPERGGASQGGMGPRRSIGKRALAVRPTVSNAVGTTLPSLAPAAASGRRKRAPVVQRGSSAFVGVHRRKQEGRWSAKIKHDGKHHHVGYFDDEQEAAAPFRRVLYTMPDIMPYRRLARQRSDMI